jgi:hypothetical protein
MNSFIQDSTIDFSLDSQQHYAHLLVFPQGYDSFIPALHLPISALLNFTNLPLFDHSLAVADLHHFFTSGRCDLISPTSDPEGIEEAGRGK